MSEEFSPATHHGSPQRRGLSTWHWLAIVAAVALVAGGGAWLAGRGGSHNSVLGGSAVGDPSGRAAPDASGASGVSGATGASGGSGAAARSGAAGPAKGQGKTGRPGGPGMVVNGRGGTGTKGGGKGGGHGGSSTSTSPGAPSSGSSTSTESGAGSGGASSPGGGGSHTRIILPTRVHISAIVNQPHGHLDYQAAAAYGEANLSNGFSPDPYSVGMTVGGAVNVNYLGSSCSGFTASAPALRVNFGGGGASLLRMYFVGSNGDPAIVVNDPYGNFYCVDDSFGTVNPTIDFNNPAGGTYDVWVCGYDANTTISGTLYLTENSGNHP